MISKLKLLDYFRHSEWLILILIRVKRGVFCTFFMLFWNRLRFVYAKFFPMSFLERAIAGLQTCNPLWGIITHIQDVPGLSKS